METFQTVEDEGVQIIEAQEAGSVREDECIPVKDDNVQVIETSDEDLLSAEENKAISLGADSIPIVEMIDEDFAETAAEESKEEEPADVQSDTDQENNTEITVDNDDESTSEDEEVEDVEETFEPGNNQDPFILDQEQQNLLWCHAKHQVKDSPSFEQYLNTTDPEQLAQLFLYLRDLFSYLPQEELDIFLNSSERIQIYYIIARLSGELGLKERANLIQQACTIVTAQSPYNAVAVFNLLTYLRDLSTALPDQELGARVRQELEQLMANMSSVLPTL